MVVNDDDVVGTVSWFSFEFNALELAITLLRTDVLFADFWGDGVDEVSESAEDAEDEDVSEIEEDFGGFRSFFLLTLVFFTADLDLNLYSVPSTMNFFFYV